jgi:small-conductance mechanosensitive channel/CRP-like cAMP-binding protein/tellurite resistance protein
MMETPSQIIQIFGFFAILASAALIFVRLVQVFVGGRVHRLRTFLELLAFLTVAYLFAAPAAQFVDLEEAGPDIEGIVAFLWWICLALVINTTLHRFVWEGVLSDHGVRRVPKLVTDGVAIALYALAIMIVMHFVYDEPIGAVLATSGAAALVVGLSAQSTIKEVFSGIALNATQALRLGDFVEIDGIYGWVFEINWRSISLMNPNTDSLYIFPNSVVAERTILNFSEPTGRFKYFVHFVAELSAPPELVIRAIAEELENSRYVLRDPKPDFNMMGFTERGIEIRIRYFFNGDDPWWDAQNEVCMAIWSAMRKHNLRIAINRRWMDSRDEWAEFAGNVENAVGAERIVQSLRTNPLFADQADADIANLVKSARSEALNPPACFYKPGDPPNGLYLVLEGRVGLYERDEDGAELKVESCGPGELFGIGSQLDDTPRRYLAQAEQYSIVAQFEGDVVSAFLKNDPEFGTALRAHLEERDASRGESRAQEKEAWLRAIHQGEKARLSEEVRRTIDKCLSKPIFHHLFDHLLSRTRHQDLLTATMAGAAMVCSARGEVDDTERSYVRLALAEADLLRHVDIGHGVTLFEDFAKGLDNTVGRERALAAVEKCRALKGGEQIVMAICHGVSGVHAAPSPEEQRVLAEIAARLGVSADLSAITPAPPEVQHKRTGGVGN